MDKSGVEVVIPRPAGLAVGYPGQTNLFDRFMVGEGTNGKEGGGRDERTRRARDGGEPMVVGKWEEKVQEGGMEQKEGKEDGMVGEGRKVMGEDRKRRKCYRRGRNVGCEKKAKLR